MGRYHTYFPFCLTSKCYTCNPQCCKPLESLGSSFASCFLSPFPLPLHSLSPVSHSFQLHPMHPHFEFVHHSSPDTAQRLSLSWGFGEESELMHLPQLTYSSHLLTTLSFGPQVPGKWKGHWDMTHHSLHSGYLLMA